MHTPIVAIATAPGRGAIGVVRVSGPVLGPFVSALLKQSLQNRHAHYLSICATDGSVIDQIIAIHFHAPHSFTGEDVLELQCHGGIAVIQQILELCLTVGKGFDLRLARPGEFSERAFLNNKIDLVQAEAIADLIDASSVSAARAAMSSLSGEFSTLVKDLADNITRLRLLVEATLDFPEEEIDFLEKYQARSQLESLVLQLKNILSKSKQGIVLRNGLHIVFVGEPNVGKSSLLNALSGEDVSIVTDIAGTTRDKVSQLIHIDGIPITITDTAGLRDTEDTIEAIGIARTWQEVERADVVLHLMDATQPFNDLDQEINKRRCSSSTVLSVVNKIDLIDDPHYSTKFLPISVRTGKGLAELKKNLLDLAGWHPTQESPWLARQRHIDALTNSLVHLDNAAAHAALDDRVLDLFAEELRLAHDELGSITGKITPDDLLGEIFSHFCIGK